MPAVQAPGLDPVGTATFPARKPDIWGALSVSVRGMAMGR